MSIKELKKQMDELRKQMKTHGKSGLDADFKEFFEKHPEITGIAWTQYAPSFNDGEPCVFSVHEFHYTKDEDPSLNDFSGYGNKDDGSGGWLEVSWRDTNPLEEAVSELEGELIDNDIFQISFGDSVKVMATKDGIVVEEYYNHD
jgi:hypothetical protein